MQDDLQGTLFIRLANFTMKNTAACYPVSMQDDLQGTLFIRVANFMKNAACYPGSKTSSGLVLVV